MKFFPLWIVKVKGSSMLPTLNHGQFLVVSPMPYWFGDPIIDDIVVVALDGLKIIKRISAIDDDAIEVLGDNEAASTDSRTFGLIGKKDIVAKCVWVIGRSAKDSP